jgi:hypothetical protein
MKNGRNRVIIMQRERLVKTPPALKKAPSILPLAKAMRKVEVA